MNPLTRRELIRRLGLGAAALVIGRRSSSAQGAGRAAAAGPPTLEALSRRFQRRTREEVLEIAAAAIAAGSTRETLLGAVFLAGLRDVSPRPVGGKFHCVLMVESAFVVSGLAARPREAWLPLLFNVDDLKASQLQDRREGDWRMPPAPLPALPAPAAPGPPDAPDAPDAPADSTAQTAPRRSREAARGEFRAAMNDWDAERADLALMSLLPHEDHASFFELLWPMAARSFASLGHGIIFAAQTERVLDRIGWEQAEPALRSLVMGLLQADAEGAGLELFETARELARSLPAGWDGGRALPERSAALVAPLRTVSPSQAQGLIAAAIAEGASPETLWDGLRLFASELCLRSPELLPVHGLTEVNAFGHAFRCARSDATRRLLLLQAAGWLALLRDGLARRRQFRPQGPGILELGGETEGPLPSLDAVFAARDAAGARRLLDAEPKQGVAFEARLVSNLLRKAVQSHQYKYLAAVHEEGRRVAPRWRSRILAPALGYLPGDDDEETALYRRSAEALRRVGVR